MQDLNNTWHFSAKAGRENDHRGPENGPLFQNERIKVEACGEKAEKIHVARAN